MKKPKKRKISLNRQRVGKLLVQQSLNGEKLNISKAMKEVGYKPRTVNSKTTDVVNSSECQAELKSFVDQIDELIQNNIAHMHKKQPKASFRDANEAVKSMSQLKQLIQGKPTDISMSVSWDDDGEKEKA